MVIEQAFFNPNQKEGLNMFKRLVAIGFILAIAAVGCTKNAETPAPEASAPQAAPAQPSAPATPAAETTPSAAQPAGAAAPGGAPAQPGH